MTQSQKIKPCLWFDSNAEEAANFYTSLFPDSRIGPILRYGDEGQEITGKPPGSVLTADFQIGGYHFTGLNGGPQFTFTPAISFWVQCETEAELDALWAALSLGGMALMPLDKYEWSEKYGWVQDRFGLTWQLALGKLAAVGQKITPFLMYVGPQHGSAEAAVTLYTATFGNSAVDGILHYPAGAGEATSTVKHAQFSLSQEKFMAIDGGVGHGFNFTEAISLEIACANQAEVDYFWERLTADGGEEGPCGWLKDKFGVSWQVTPMRLAEMLRDPDPAKTNRVTRAFLQMKKFDIAALERAYAGAVE
jgi:predicted 3-demethylubiquinone-9 3-methyltransferase (glyoxalase superfamily)